MRTALALVVLVMLAGGCRRSTSAPPEPHAEPDEEVLVDEEEEGARGMGDRDPFRAPSTRELLEAPVEDNDSPRAPAVTGAAGARSEKQDLRRDARERRGSDEELRAALGRLVGDPAECLEGQTPPRRIELAISVWTDVEGRIGEAELSSGTLSRGALQCLTARVRGARLLGAPPGRSTTTLTFAPDEESR